jgi:putative ABC transport system permease protein
MQGKELGLDKENVLIVANTQRLGDKEETFRQELAASNGINAVSISTSIPSGNAFGDGYVPEPGEGDKLLVNDLSIFSYLTDENFIPSMRIGIVKGRNFSKEFSDSASVIINETAARQIGWKDPIGKWLRYPGGDDTRFKVIGVVKDFTVQSFREVLVPFALFHHSSKTYSDAQSFMIVRINAGQYIPGDRVAGSQMEIIYTGKRPRL